MVRRHEQPFGVSGSDKPLSTRALEVFLNRSRPRCGKRASMDVSDMRSGDEICERTRLSAIVTAYAFQREVETVNDARVKAPRTVDGGACPRA
ncbi:hypothetical protein DFO66_103210 [Brevibacterium sanguinis]|uniref:Uncharacterized protein n=2 Tax=Brevibacterium TaxID=1696 RepID=A0A366IKF9_9MICO|nr:hypothetical protein DFO66_103210 [Brevibacterium sanguinis]RBP72917.1 hypothetical protein DFO65_103209 [Brevibacterium celere]